MEGEALSQTNQAVDGSTAPKAQKKGVSKSSDNKKLLDGVLKFLEDDKAEEIVSISLKGKSEMADHMIICSGRSSRQVTSIAEKLSSMLKKEFDVFSKVEGKDQGDWVLIDAGDIIVHVFRPEVREFYQLEKMWLDPSQAAADI